MSTKQTGRIALAGVLSALALALLLSTYLFATASIAVAGVAALCGIPVVVELGRKAGLLHFATVAVLSTLLALAAEGTGVYIAFFGWYTVFKSFIEGKNLPRVAEWVIKIGVFAAAVTAYGTVWVFLLKMPIPKEFALWMLPLLIVGLCAVFVVYDIGMTRVVGLYHLRIRPKISHLFHF